MKGLQRIIGLSLLTGIVTVTFGCASGGAPTATDSAVTPNPASPSIASSPHATSSQSRQQGAWQQDERLMNAVEVAQTVYNEQPQTGARLSAPEEDWDVWFVPQGLNCKPSDKEGEATLVIYSGQAETQAGISDPETFWRVFKHQDGTFDLYDQTFNPSTGQAVGYIVPTTATQEQKERLDQLMTEAAQCVADVK